MIFSPFEILKSELKKRTILLYRLFGKKQSHLMQSDAHF